MRLPWDGDQIPNCLPGLMSRCVVSAVFPYQVRFQNNRLDLLARLLAAAHELDVILHPTRIIFFSAALRFGASADRSRTTRAPLPLHSVSASCSNSKSCDARFGPVMMNPAGILSLPWHQHPPHTHGKKKKN